MEMTNNGNLKFKCSMLEKLEGIKNMSKGKIDMLEGPDDLSNLKFKL